MDETFKTKFGKIRIREKKILIDDISNIQYFIIKSMLVLNLATGIMMLISRGIDGSFISTLWVVLCFSTIVVFVVLMRLTHKKELLPAEIKSIKYSKSFNNHILDFKLKNNKIRKIYLSKDSKYNEMLLSILKTTLKLDNPMLGHSPLDGRGQS
jgi:hypothetical protein